jgi:hypothetical protein
MIIAELKRLTSGDTGTFGVLSVDGKSWITGELPWRNNAKGKSCVPEGEYRVWWGRSPKHGMCYHVLDVPGRQLIQIHSGNYCGDKERGWKSDVEGCILLGKDVVDLEQRMVTSSRMAMREFHAHMKERGFTLRIINQGVDFGKEGKSDNQ